MSAIKLTTPLTNEAINALKAGDEVLISGTIYAARDAAHKQFGLQPPFDLQGQIIYYASPTPTKPGEVIGSIGPTTSSRMDAFTPALLAAGLKGMIGKGSRGPEVIEAIKKHQAVYFTVPGGAAALLAKRVKTARLLAYPELHSEAALELTVDNFPATVTIDSTGGNLFEAGRNKYAK
ncbi:fumarate hydratase [candidate division WOR-1 bacterium RIFOXYA12_FULL_52_29]|uniref:Fumarate hydratase n=1 Tax=candidate division WOR-1 bacterium RIFOXYC12_FULL_54_18 TaxID=1802584 RepID=A0A1F4T7B2_UNCSA|nr:MAG: fumarate hydratase [candidate division WOR-1 bacterium RIFOXYA2_FULL_51_19]OGC18181.1 MAG: fumarate hydratase [candidate division WOR-1 bacterium RIFOXYA12_FULL_52_29]OGC27036.1 MAG: fumarate hydratase [candidate division WOR-1 bacterium RIFOXYB2_FULL_45_9]OGC28598.1 MAG: fumarate hydratase [candidate division WOR-1 bacterium RIFOXYC12_FULL_54_18]OGC30947.1 MAG: fumarate hydratase [candidate division WOR-1 bacterium RIFOXYB12_FULL_52_16]